MYTGFMADLWLGMILVVGGTVGTVCTLRRANGRRERNVLIWACSAAWLGAIGFFAGIFLIPRPFGVLLWVPYGIGIPLCISAFRKRCRRARESDAAAAHSE